MTTAIVRAKEYPPKLAMAQIVYISFTEDRRAAIPATSRMIVVDCTVEPPRIAIRRVFWLLPLIPVFLVLAFCLCVLRRNHV